MTPELFITRHNHLVDPLVHVWAWQIPVYLFLGGWVAGNMILTGNFMLGGRPTKRSPLLARLPIETEPVSIPSKNEGVCSG